MEFDIRELVQEILEEVGMGGSRPRNMAVDDFLMYATECIHYDFLCRVYPL